MARTSGGRADLSHGGPMGTRWFACEVRVSHVNAVSGAGAGKLVAIEDSWCTWYADVLLGRMASHWNL